MAPIPQILAKDSEDQEWNLAEIGWPVGAATRASVGANYDVTTTFTV